MELEITTKMSILVGLSGFLAEIIFRETLTSSIPGVILSVVLAAIILCCTYFAMDGLQKSFLAIHKREENRRREYDEKLFRLLNKKLSDQVKLEKGIYSLIAKGVKGDMSMADTGAAQDYWRELAESIDSSSLKAAKLVVKYNQKSQEESGRIMGQSSEEMLQELRSMSSQLQLLNGEIQELAIRATAMAEENDVPEENVLAEGDEEDFSTDQEPMETTTKQEQSIEELLQAAGEEFFQPQEEEEVISPQEEIEADVIVQQEEETNIQPQEEIEADVNVEQGEETNIQPREGIEADVNVQQDGEEDIPLQEEVEADFMLLQDEIEADVTVQQTEETDIRPQDEIETDSQTREERDISPAQSAVQQGIEDVDVNRMMEELFNESLGVELNETLEEQAPSESTIKEEAEESSLEMKAAPNEEEDISEEDLDSLLSGLLPEPEPLIEESLEKTIEKTLEEAIEEPEESARELTALDMLLSKQKTMSKSMEGEVELEIASSESSTEKSMSDPEELEILQIDTKSPTEEASLPILEPISESEDSEEIETLESEMVSEPGEEEKTESDSDADTGKMSPDDIAALLASLDS